MGMPTTDAGACGYPQAEAAQPTYQPQAEAAQSTYQPQAEAAKPTYQPQAEAAKPTYQPQAYHEEYARPVYEVRLQVLRLYQRTNCSFPEYNEGSYSKNVHRLKPIFLDQASRKRLTQ